MSNEAAERAWAEWRYSDAAMLGSPGIPNSESFMAGRSSRDAEVAALRQSVAVSAGLHRSAETDLDATLKALGESRARFGDMEQRALAAEATCQHPFAILKFDGGRRAIVCNTCWQIVTHLAPAETGDNR